MLLFYFFELFKLVQLLEINYLIKINLGYGFSDCFLVVILNIF